MRDLTLHTYNKHILLDIVVVPFHRVAYKVAIALGKDKASKNGRVFGVTILSVHLSGVRDSKFGDKKRSKQSNFKF